MQNNIADILRSNQLIPVVTIHDRAELDRIFQRLKTKNITCIEITLRTDYAWEAIQTAKQVYGKEFKIGVGTITSVEAIERCMNLQVDFMVSPGLTTNLARAFEDSGIAFLPGVATPSEIISAMEQGFRYLKFFPAHLFGGLKALQTYSALFPMVTFCPTGGINKDNYPEFLALKNVLSVGGSWLTEE
jgi:2-dehydro-3-deoxyphosphogluconate aldolase/(4S)-4-hydroxy-2-oxoglutarate aldolase